MPLERRTYALGFVAMVGEGARGYGVCDRCAQGRGYVGRRKLHVRAPARECLGMGCSFNVRTCPRASGVAECATLRHRAGRPWTSLTSMSVLTPTDNLSSPLSSHQLPLKVLPFASHGYADNVPAQSVMFSQAYDEGCGHRARARVVSAFRRQHLGFVTIHSLRSAI
jgi:hypothetical protein